MKLARHFYRLPVRFDVERLRAEVEALPADAWSRHPSEYEGNTAARLITVGGVQNDLTAGAARRNQPLVAAFFGSPYAAVATPALPAAMLTYDFGDAAVLEEGVAILEEFLLPAVEESGRDAEIIADGGDGDAFEQMPLEGGDLLLRPDMTTFAVHG